MDQHSNPFYPLELDNRQMIEKKIMITMMDDEDEDDGDNLALAHLHNLDCVTH